MKSKFLHQITKGHLIIAGMIAALTALQVWTWAKRHPLISIKEQELSQILDLEKEVLEMESRWNAMEAERNRVEENLRRASERLFEGDPASSTWSAQIESPLNPLSFSVRPDRALAHPKFPDNLTILPTQWTIKNTGQDSPGLDALLAFLHDLITKQPKWVDLVELAISGNEVTQTRAEFSLRLWFKKEAV